MSRLGILLAECAWIAQNDADQLATYGELVATAQFPPHERPMTKETRVEVERLRVLGSRLAYRAREEGQVYQGTGYLFGAEGEEP